MPAKKLTKKIAHTVPLRKMGPPPAPVKTRKQPATRTAYIQVEAVEFESGVPIPHPTECNTLAKAGSYPLAKLEIGQSFTYPLMRGTTQQVKQRSALNAAIRKYKEANPKTEFVFRQLDAEGVVRVWRVQPDFFKQRN